ILIKSIDRSVVGTEIRQYLVAHGLVALDQGEGTYSFDMERKKFTSAAHAEHFRLYLENKRWRTWI
ncbi:hypothetical protein HDU96_004934, partial [Phlyctochytrium bullatum]